MIESRTIRCPFCGERFEALVDASAGDADYVEDCPVCCRPWVVVVERSDGEASVSLMREDE
jgi:hypothetical protein